MNCEQQAIASDAAATRSPFVWPANIDWSKLLAPFLKSQIYHDLGRFVAEERTRHEVFPRAKDVFNALRLTPLSNVRVVILGQDPYHQPGQAHGLAFSVPSGVRLPPSLRNILRELADDLGQPHVTAPESGDLSHWAEQGVLLLNRVLTVRCNQAGSHQRRGWEQFTDAVVRTVLDQNRPIVFVLWGKEAGRMAPLIKSPHEVIESPHPSPLSAHRGFFGSRPFSRVNQFLNRRGCEPIRWISTDRSTGKYRG